MSRVADPYGTPRDRAVYLPETNTLVAADLHLGRAASSAVEVPLNEGAAVVDRLLALVDRYEPRDVVLAGDVLDAFGHVPRSARRALGSLRTGVESAGGRLRSLEGNHDTQLGAITQEAPGESLELDDGTVVCHGHERPAASGPRYVVGHDHPAIDIEGRRRPCFLYGPRAFEGADVLALPAFNPAVPGTTVNTWEAGEPLSPLLAEVARFHPVVWDGGSEDLFVFPPLGVLQSYL